MSERDSVGLQILWENELKDRRKEKFLLRVWVVGSGEEVSFTRVSC